MKKVTELDLISDTQSQLESNKKNKNETKPLLLESKESQNFTKTIDNMMSIEIKE